MLQNSKYAGRWTFGARSWKKSPTTGKRVNRPGQSPLIEVALPELRIVDEETWSRVLAINEEARERHAAVGPSAYAREGGASTARRVYPMSTLIRCGICGGPMVIEKTQKPRYRCDASRGNGGRCDNSRTVMEDALREAFTSAMLRYFDRPEVVAHLIEASKTELARAQRSVPDEKAEAAKALGETRGKIDNLVDLASRGAAPATVLDKIRELEALADKQERHLQELELRSSHSTHRDPRTSSRVFANSVRCSTRAPRTREKRSSISSTMAFGSTRSKTGTIVPAGPSAEAPFSSLERQSPRRAPRASKSGQRYGLRGPDLNRRPSGYEFTKAGLSQTITTNGNH